jgi:hypothetical protein
MPENPDFAKVHAKMIKDYGKEKGDSVYYAWLKKHGYDDKKPFPGKKESVEIRINERLKFSVPFVVESVDKVSEAGCKKIKGTMLKATTSRNGRTYEMAEIEKAKKIVSAFEEAEARGSAVTVVGSKMIDPPVVKRAQRILQLAAAN